MNLLPSVSRMYRALARRDRTFEGIFVVGVKTTGIFCRPSCPARKPRPENCEFFGSAGDALRRGYRPCLRCKPGEPSSPPSRAVTVLLEQIEREPGRRLADRDLQALGIDPSTARRSFRKHCGMTFQAYQRARSMGMAIRGLTRGGTVAAAAATSGYDSFSGFGAAFKKIVGAPPRSASSCLLADWIATPLGPMVAIADASGLWLLEFHDRRALARELAWVRRRTQAAVVPGRNAVLRQIARELEAYFAGRALVFDTPLHLAGSPFQAQVWAELRRIAPGTTRSYGEVAAAIGAASAVRAVGRANGENRLAIIVPCHRVIRGDGTLCGYGGGLWRKRWLLDHEAARSRPALR